MKRSFARYLRQNQSEAETLLWQRLRAKKLGYKFRRQEPIGVYIVDFLCFKKKIVIEVDGDHHAFQEEYDQKRTEWLESRG